MEHKIDATNKVLGRLAGEVSILLRGKNNPDFNPARMREIKVTVFNTDKMHVTGKKMKQKIYYRHSGFHGGLKAEALESVLRRDSRLALLRAISGMLPKNKLRPRLLKNLNLVKGEK